MESICPICKKPYDGVICTQCTVSDLDPSGQGTSERLGLANAGEGESGAAAFLVDLVSNRKIPVAAPRCKVGRDDLNDIVISGDQSISRFHFIISKENGDYYVQDNKSRHGTFLNGNQITTARPIHDGDVLKVGISLFWFVIESNDPSVTNESPVITPMALQNEELPFAPEPASAAATGMSGSVSAGRGNASVKEELVEKDNSTATNLPKQAPNEVAGEAPNQVSNKGPNKGANKGPNKGGNKAANEAMNPLPEYAPEYRAADIMPAQNDYKFEPLTAKAADADALASETKPKPRSELLQQLIRSGYKEEASDENAAAPEVIAKQPAETSLGAEAAINSTKDQDSLKAPAPEGTAADQTDAAGQDKTSEPRQTDGKLINKFAEIIEESSQTSTLSENKEDKALPDKISADNLADPKRQDMAEIKTDIAGSSLIIGKSEIVTGTNQAMSAEKQTEKEPLNKVAVPEWCQKYFSSELSGLSHELEELNEQVKLAQEKIKEVEARATLTEGLRDTLLCSQDEDLVQGCAKVLGMLGWTVKISDDDKQELRLETEDKIACIARVVWTETQADRTHLGQLSISQTRFWCEEGVEPKGILIVNKTGDHKPSPANVGDSAQELADYAATKNVCLMTTLQLLAVYKDLALSDGDANKLRETIVITNGWLANFDLEQSK